jgi:hypothetical protein
MRIALETEKGKRKKFKAVFVRLGKKTNYKGYSEETILLKEIADAETLEPMADHLWFSYSKGFQKLVLTPGTLIEFEARVKPYKKGYIRKGINKHRTTDYKLSHPTKIKRAG